MLKAVGHLMLAGIFIFGGSSAFLEPGGRVQKVESAGIPQPKQAVTLNGAIMVFGGTLLALGIFPRFAALMLFGSLVPTTFVGHSFWTEENDASRKAQQTQFLKNLGLMGGLLIVLKEG
ncbi:MAG TPA: DoxX family protein [Ktedonobacteraceae bacterium]|nr:DoxX family protein [Ktedonobacteraceae bacterium]